MQQRRCARNAGKTGWEQRNCAGEVDIGLNVPHFPSDGAHLSASRMDLARHHPVWNNTLDKYD